MQEARINLKVIQNKARQETQGSWEEVWETGEEWLSVNNVKPGQVNVEQKTWADELTDCRCEWGEKKTDREDGTGGDGEYTGEQEISQYRITSLQKRNENSDKN